MWYAMYTRLSFMALLKFSLMMILVGSYTPKSPLPTVSLTLRSQSVKGSERRRRIQEYCSRRMTLWVTIITTLGPVSLFRDLLQEMLKKSIT